MAKLTLEQYSYCSSDCPIGRNKRDALLRDCESASDAAFDMRDFVHKCSKNCDIVKNWERVKNAAIYK